MNTATPNAEKIYDLLKSFSTAMLVTHSGTDLRARPMAIADIGHDLEIWFITAEDTAKVHEIVEETHVHVVCQKDHTAYLSVSGTATVLRDRSKVDDLWREPFRVWFPDGKDDPNMVLIRVRPQQAEYWDQTGFNRIAYMWEATKAYFTGSQPRVPEETHGVVSLR